MSNLALPTGHGVSSLTLTHRVEVEARLSSYAPTQRSWSEQLGPNPGYGVSFWTPTQVGN